MYGRSKQGFSFIELMVVIFLLGIMATMIVPNLQQRLPGHQRTAFINELNTLFAFCWQSSLTTQTVHRVFFDLKKRIARVEIEEYAPGSSDPSYKAVSQAYRPTSYEWPETIEIKNFYIDGTDEFGKSDRDVLTLWFYVVPEGLSQEVIINIVDTNQGQNVEQGLVLNPFTVQLKVYDSPQKP